MSVCFLSPDTFPLRSFGYIPKTIFYSKKEMATQGMGEKTGIWHWPNGSEYLLCNWSKLSEILCFAGLEPIPFHSSASLGFWVDSPQVIIFPYLPTRNTIDSRNIARACHDIIRAHKLQKHTSMTLKYSNLSKTMPSSHRSKVFVVWS